MPRLLVSLLSKLRPPLEALLTRPHLPLEVMATLLAIAVALELVTLPELLWEPKLPLALLLLAAAARILQRRSEET
ncbi:MAG: hypothetical protein AAGD01_14520 [Acidobacteriota bacterium]